MRMRYQREVIALMILIVGAVALYATFTPVRCNDFACFEAHMAKCRPATYINDVEKEASWKYGIMGTSNKKCDVEVTLLIAKESNLDLRLYEGDTMICSHPIGISGYPEKNLAACNGELKEGLQSIVIEKLYKYIVTNLGDIREELISY
ncbi:MAG: hypothetical protein ACP5N7_03195 [Candidatus Pacearchaeota archaeon]